MEINNLIIQWKRELDNMGVLVDSAALELIEDNEEEGLEIGIDELNAFKDDVIFTIKTDMIWNFFDNTFEDANLVEHFNLNFGLFVDISESGDIELKDDVETDSLGPELTEKALTELIGIEKTNTIIMKNVFEKDLLENELSKEIEQKMISYFEPLGKTVASKLNGFVEELHNIINQNQ